jgi:hypothetical protein
MGTLIILIGLIVLGGYLSTTWDYDLLGESMCFLFGLLFIIHIFAWGTTSYRYNQFVAQRNAFEQTLQEARKSGNVYETAAIVKEVTQWNVDLAEQKYDNKTFFFSPYVDDRIVLLKPIK